MKTIVLAKEEKKMLQEKLQNISSPYKDCEKTLAELHQIFSQLSLVMLKNIFSFKLDIDEPGVLLLRELPVDELLPETPSDGKRSENKKTFVSEACLLGFAGLLGEIYGYKREKEGEIIHNVCPVSKGMFTQSNESSKVNLEFHNEINVDNSSIGSSVKPPNPDFILLSCLRKDTEGKGGTTYIESKNIFKKLTKEESDLLRKPVFQHRIPDSFVKNLPEGDFWSAPRPILTGPDDSPEMSLDFGSGVRGISKKAEKIIGVLKEICSDPEIIQTIYLQPGDVLVINNRKGLHGRTPFTPNFNGKDRWLQRAYTRGNLWDLRTADNQDIRIF